MQNKQKNLAAVELGRLGGLATAAKMTRKQLAERARAGGIASATRLLPNERTRRAKLASKARWFGKTTLTGNEIKTLFLSGRTQLEIAQSTGVTSVRVSQILKNLGVHRSKGGATLRGKKKLLAVENSKDEQCFTKWGVNRTEKKNLLQKYGTAPFKSFVAHKANSARRHIAFQLGFKEWWEIWQKSGHWNERRGQKKHGFYVMARHQDRGSYAPDNVKIITQSENMREHKRLKPP